MVGPNLMGPTGSVATGIGLPALAGAFLTAAAVFAIAGLLSFLLS